MSKAEALKNLLKDRALRLGFQLFGVAPARRLEADLERYHSWIEAGRHGSMTWLTQDWESRADPAPLLPGARSVLALGMSYAQKVPNLSKASGHPEGRIARFALGQDYHAVLLPRLEELAAFLRDTSPHCHTRCCVDTTPVLERAFAREAGLGFIGRNNCLIHPVHGSWFLLGLVIITDELPIDQPLETLCGDCTECLEACPGKALVAPWTLDSRRCLSWCTIENKKNVPSDLERPLEDRLFGCDACQEACPFNRAPLPCSEKQLRPDGSDDLPEERYTLQNIFALGSNREFQRVFKGTGLLRPQRKGLIRNAATVAANLGRQDLAPALRNLESGDPSESVRQVARASLLRLSPTAIS
ncbi:tRNA epoxyqueuosine(34) reductase QueG [bacterium]|nr:tRNA epoxyqueuosine(34) reductase QueG [bacterium]